MTRTRSQNNFILILENLNTNHSQPENLATMEILLQTIQQHQNQVVKLTHNQKRDQRNEWVDDDAQGSHYQHQ